MTHRDAIRARIAELWADRLESGRVPQAIGYLRDEDEGPERCCLGVLIDLYIEKGGDQVVDQDGSYGIAAGMDWQEWEEGYLPQPVREWAGLTNANPYILDGTSPVGEFGTAIWMNDSAQMSFEEIAAAVRDMPTTE